MEKLQSMLLSLFQYKAQHRVLASPPNPELTCRVCGLGDAQQLEPEADRVCMWQGQQQGC